MLQQTQCKMLRIKTDNKTNSTEEASEVANTDKTKRSTEETSEVAKTDKINRTKEASEVANTDNKTPRTDERSEGAHAVTKDFAAHDNRKSGAARLTRCTTKAHNDKLKTGAVGKLPTDADGNRKPYKKAK